jgi:hypothetical protein
MGLCPCASLAQSADTGTEPKGTRPALPLAGIGGSGPVSDWQFGAVVDGAYGSNALALGRRDKGLGLGHSDLIVRGLINEHLHAEAIMGFHTTDRNLEQHLEHAWLQTRSLPYGLQLRAGRFASLIAYLNELHPHADDFTERPLLYRGFLGGHWYDDGLRLNWIAPNPFYLRLGAELFSGKQLVPDARADAAGRVSTLNLKLGSDLGPNSTWQWGLSQLRNQREAKPAVHSHDDESGLGEVHSHAAAFSGRRMLLSDLVWKWAPEGNNRNQQWRVHWEYAQVGGINRFAPASMRHRSSSLGAVWRFQPAWELGVRTDRLRAFRAEQHDEEVAFAAGKLKERAFMIVYKPTHMQTLRLQFTQQSGSGLTEEGEPIFSRIARRNVQLQYVIGFGTHAAHAF